MKNIKEFETALLKRLSAKNVDKIFLKNASNAIVNLRKQGLVIDQVYIKGKPRPDRVIINGTPDPEFWAKFTNIDVDFERFEIFPYGIIRHDGHRIRATIGV